MKTHLDAVNIVKRNFSFVFLILSIILIFYFFFLAGSSTSDTALDANLCGTGSSTVEYTSTDRYILVTFTSDASGVSQGFEMTYFSVPDTCK